MRMIRFHFLHVAAADSPAGMTDLRCRTGLYAMKSSNKADCSEPPLPHGTIY